MDQEERCIFCRIVRGEAVAYRIPEDEHSLGILDINPLSRGHCLVIPKRHEPWWHDLTVAENESLFRVTKVIAERLRRSFQPDFVCMYARYRSIPYTHLFLVPTYSGDPLDRFFDALEGFQEAPDALSASKLADEMKARA